MGATVGHEESHSLWEGMEVKFYVIRLKAEERDELTRLVKTGREAAYRRRNAQILLLADQCRFRASLTRHSGERYH